MITSCIAVEGGSGSRGVAQGHGPAVLGRVVLEPDVRGELYVRPVQVDGPAAVRRGVVVEGHRSGEHDRAGDAEGPPVARGPVVPECAALERRLAARCDGDAAFIASSLERDALEGGAVACGALNLEVPEGINRT